MLNLNGDPYNGESILVHEFAHAIHQMAVIDLNPTFHQRLEACLKAAKAEGRWEGTYAATNPYEFWAEAVQAWFECNLHDDFQHNHVDTRAELLEYEPTLYALCKEVFGEENTWIYERSDKPERSDPHLQNLDRDALPKFAWGKDEPPVPAELP